MTVVVWTRAFETGIREIDDQHRRLVDYINELAAADTGSLPETVGDVLESAIDYTLYHFAFEECLLETRGYPHLEAHRRVHAGFAGDLQQMKQQFNAGRLDARELGGSLSRWLFEHISNADTAATRFSQ